MNYEKGGAAGQVSDYERKMYKDASKATPRGSGPISNMERKLMRSEKRGSRKEKK